MLSALAFRVPRLILLLTYNIFCHLELSTKNLINSKLHSYLDHISENTIIVEQIESFELKKINEGIVTVWVSWSPGFNSCMMAIKYLNSLNYSGKIYIVDIDDFSAPEKNPYLFGKILHGWGEIFIIKDGLVSNEFLGKESFSRFKMFFEQRSIS